MRKLCRSESDAIHINVLISCALLVALFSWFGGLRFVTSLPHFCLFEYALGFPCPGCDITAALLALARLDIHRSILIQPCGVALASTVFIQSTIRGGYLLRLINIQRTNQAVTTLSIAFTALLLLFWIFRVFNQ
jgi:fucose 4-O-acetylase-like acetyltransferase